MLKAEYMINYIISGGHYQSNVQLYLHKLNRDEHSQKRREKENVTGNHSVHFSVCFSGHWVHFYPLLQRPVYDVISVTCTVADISLQCLY